MFPVGSFTKDVVKKIASASGNITYANNFANLFTFYSSYHIFSGFDKIAKKKESMGVCFVGKKKAFADFLTVIIVS
jgi:tRNA U34 2-thiouridine synthase MnmA/TrmU